MYLWPYHFTLGSSLSHKEGLFTRNKFGRKQISQTVKMILLTEYSQIDSDMETCAPSLFDNLVAEREVDRQNIEVVDAGLIVIQLHGDGIELKRDIPLFAHQVLKS